MTEICKIKTIIDGERLSTQEVLQQIYQQIEDGVTNFEVEACGQHDIGGAVWAKDRSKTLNFLIKNPGQRVGAMAMEGTKIIVEGSVPADIGWLNSGAKIVVKGDAGDTAAHCAAGGKIYVSGRVGTRSGALMKHDPRYIAPEFWVLKNTGSFSFEFMSGGTAVVCGYDSENLDSVLGRRSCVGMVGGIVYVRGNIQELDKCVELKELDEKDKNFLKTGMIDFLHEIDKEDLLEKLLNFSEWKKIVPLPKENLKTKEISVKDFMKNEWFYEGLFGDLVADDGKVYSLAGTGEERLRIPQWEKDLCVGCNLCLENCPQKSIKENDKIYTTQEDLCIGCGICSAVCPQKAWKLIPNHQG